MWYPMIAGKSISSNHQRGICYLLPIDTWNNYLKVASFSLFGFHFIYPCYWEKRLKSHNAEKAFKKILSIKKKLSVKKK